MVVDHYYQVRVVEVLRMVSLTEQEEVVLRIDSEVEDGMDSVVVVEELKEDFGP